MVSAPDGEEDQVVDNGERVVVAHLKIFLGAILGFSLGPNVKVSNPNPAFIGTIDESSGEYYLSVLEEQKVRKRF